MGGVPCIHPCVPSSRCLSPHLVPRAGSSPAALTGPNCIPAAVGELTQCDAQVWGYTPRCPTWDQTQSPAHSLLSPRDTMNWGKSWQRRGQTPPGLWLGLYRRQEASGSHPAAICFHLPLSAPPAASLPIPIGILPPACPRPTKAGLAGGGGGVMRSILPSPQAAFIPGWLPPPPPLPARAPQGWQENNSEEDE